MLRRPSNFDESVFIGLGTNMGALHQNLEAALSYLRQNEKVRIIACSKVLASAPWGGVKQPDFLNSMVHINTAFSPWELLAFLKAGEKEIGRIPSARWGPRLIDMDIVVFGNRVIRHPELTIPHRELTHRSFVLTPLLELAPSIVHPQTGTPMHCYLEINNDGHRMD